MNDLLKSSIIKLKIENKDYCLYVSLNNSTNFELLLDKIAGMIFENPAVIVLDGQEITDKKFVEISQKIGIMCLEFDSTLLIKNRVDVAFIVKSDGVVLDSDAVDVDDAKSLLSDSAIIWTVGNKFSDNTDCSIFDDKFFAKNKTLPITKIV